MIQCRVRPVSVFALATGLSVLAILPATSADLYRDDGYKDGPAIVAFPGWAGFYAGGHIGGGWGNGGRDVSVRGGTGGGGGGGGGDNNWKPDGSRKADIDGKDGASGDLGGAGGLGGNRKADGTPVDELPNNPNIDGKNKRLGGNGGDGGEGGLVTGSTNDHDGITGGLHLGYNWQHENIVLGVEGDVSLNGGLDSYLASLRARLGISSNDMLFYVTGGLALRDTGSTNAIGLATDGAMGGDGGRNDDGQRDGDGEAGHPESRGGVGGTGGAGGAATAAGFDGTDGESSGYVVGAGVEYMLSSNVSVGVEGLWYSFDEDDLTVIRGRLTFHLDRPVHPGFKDSYMSASVANWSGFYAGGNFGGGFGDSVASVKSADGGDGVDGGAGAKGRVNSGSPPQTDGIDDPGGAGGGGGGGAAALVSLGDGSGIIGGIHLGYNWQDGERVFGIEGDAAIGDSDFRDYLASLRFRLGHSFDNVLVYGTAGVAFAGRGSSLASISLTSAIKGDNGGHGAFENDPDFDDGEGVGGAGGLGGAGSDVITTSGDSINKVGFVVGAGFDVKLWENTSLGVEGLYYGFDGDGAKSTATTFTAGDDLSTAIIRARLSFHLQEEHDALK
ncbi:MAG: outer membrane protein [Rhodomicrobiaceae bacterium]